jgi:hypothetical protein
MSALPSLPVRRAVLTVVGVAAVLQSLMVLAFAWPAGRTAPRDLPVVASGPASAVDRFATGLDRVHPGAFDVQRVASPSAARSAIRGREAYGAVLIDRSAGTPTVLVATAASPAVATLLNGLAAELGTGPRARVEDVAPAPAGDPRAGVLSAMLLPVVMTSVIGGAGLALLVGSARARAAGVAGLAVLGGLAVTSIGHAALGGLTGPFLGEAGIVALIVLAVSATVAGAGSVGGHRAIVPAAMTMMLLGNPLSGATSAPELLPQPWGTLGQLLPPGAGSLALRSVTYFDGVALAPKVAVLLGWVAVGAALLAVADVRSRRLADGTPSAEAASARVPVAV